MLQPRQVDRLDVELSTGYLINVFYVEQQVCKVSRQRSEVPNLYNVLEVLEDKAKSSNNILLQKVLLVVDMTFSVQYIVAD